MKYFLLLFTLIILSFPKLVLAKEVSLQLYPPITKIRVYEKGLVEFKVNVKNNSPILQEYNIELLPFEVKDGNSGQIKPSLTTSSSYLALFQDISFLDQDKSIKTLKLLPQEKKDVTIAIDIKDNQLNGDYYFSLLFTSLPATDNPDSYSQIQNSLSSNVLLSLALGSDLKSSLIVSEFKTNFFFFNGPIPFSTTITNQGTNFDTVKGYIEIKNMFGQKIAKLQLFPQNVLSRQSRRLNNPPPTSDGLNIKLREQYMNNVVWDESFLFGYYQAKLVLENSDKITTGSSNFIAIPLIALIIIVIIISVVISIYLRVIKKRS